jgi:hypothetical protein
VFSTTCNPASITAITSKWQPFSLIFSQGNRKVGWVVDDSHVVFGQKFSGEKGSVRQCVVVMQQPVFLSPMFRVKSSHILMQSPLNVTEVWRIDCFACQNEFFVNNPLDVKKMSMLLTLLLTCLTSFGLH